MPGEALSLFISYSRTDSAFVDRLEADLKARSFQVWVDRRKLEGGDQWLNEIQKQIDRCHACLVVVSPGAIASEYVNMEYGRALRLRKRVIPVYHRLISDEEWPIDLERLQRVDFQGTYDQGLADLLNALSRLENKTFPATQPLTNSTPPTSTGRAWLFTPPQPAPPAPSYEYQPPNSYGTPAPTYNAYPSPSGPPSTPAAFGPPSQPGFGAPPPPGFSAFSQPMLPVGGWAAPPARPKKRIGGPLATWFCALCLLIGVGASIGVLSASWQWAVGTIVVLALLSYLLGYRHATGILPFLLIFLVSAALVFVVTQFLATFPYDQAQMGLTWFGLDRTVTLRNQIIFGAALGGGGVIYEVIFGIIGYFGADDLNDLLGTISSVAFLGAVGNIVVWLIVAVLGLVFDWPFGFGYGWAFTLLAGTPSILIGGLGLITSGYVCYKALD